MRKLFLSLILSLVVFAASAAGISNYKELLAFAKAVNKEADISMWQNEKGEVCLTADIDMKKGKKFPTINTFNGGEESHHRCIVPPRGYNFVE